jgi:hypothetical protein
MQFPLPSSLHKRGDLKWSVSTSHFPFFCLLSLPYKEWLWNTQFTFRLCFCLLHALSSSTPIASAQFVRTLTLFYADGKRFHFFLLEPKTKPSQMVRLNGCDFILWQSLKQYSACILRGHAGELLHTTASVTITHINTWKVVSPQKVSACLFPANRLHPDPCQS